MIPPPATPRSDGAVALLSTLTEDELVSADQRYPKWATMCQLRRIGLPVLNAALLTPGQGHRELEAAITALAAATGRDQLMVRSDGGAEVHRYYKGGNTFPLAEGASKAAGLLEAGRAVILMEPTKPRSWPSSIPGSPATSLARTPSASTSQTVPPGRSWRTSS